jgi:hypothetical protein
MGLHGSGLLRRSVKIRLLVPGLDFILHDQQQLGRPMGHMPPSPSVGHPGLPDPSHVVDIPIKYTHNSSPRSSPRFIIPPTSFSSETKRILKSFKTFYLIPGSFIRKSFVFRLGIATETPFFPRTPSFFPALNFRRCKSLAGNLGSAWLSYLHVVLPHLT